MKRFIGLAVVLCVGIVIGFGLAIYTETQWNMKFQAISTQLN